MEMKKIFISFLLILVAAVTVSVYISILYQTYQGFCNTKLFGSSTYILTSLKSCVENCWSKHNFGKDTYNDDCFMIELNSSSLLSKDSIESFLNSSIPTKVYFDSLNENMYYKVKVRYNYTTPEISLIRFEMS